jgi:CheY-like chemotaxis protein
MSKQVLVFLVEDDLDDQGLFHDALAEIDKNIQLVTAVNGVEAMRKFNHETYLVPDYIFMDLNMPLMNGLQCLREFKKIPSFENVPVIIYSTSCSERDIQEAHKAGAFYYFRKPYSFLELCSELKIVLQKAAEGNTGRN